MRGKVLRAAPFGFSTRITPAYAGKSELCVLVAELTEDHPRICGEKLLLVVCLAPVMGSPPHMRGKVTSAFFVESRTGITPAYAGKRAFGSMGAEIPWDHPRICGEKTGAPWRWLMVTGSPPHMRGKVSKYSAKPADYRITPAYAGKRHPHTALQGLVWDHPRICGEKDLCAQLEGAPPGSPPHMRGKGLVRPA